MPNNKTALYSILTNSYDNPQDINLPGVKCFLFTDNPDIKAKGWEIIPIDKTEDCLLQRKIKILGHPILSEFDVTIYIDANMQPKPRFLSILRQYRGGFYVGKHIKRNCVYAEGLEVKKQGKADAEKVDAHIQNYYKNNFPVNFGMYSTGIMIRDKSCKELNKVWYSELMEHTHRDQLSLPYALKETGVKSTEINIHQFVTIKPHKSKEIPKVFYSTPFDRNRNIGGANNEFIELLPDNAWICITDSDAMFLNPDYGKRIEDIIMKYGQEWSLIGCLTNRIGSNHQCYKGEFSNDMDMRNHWAIANSELPDTIIEGGVAGFFMLFSKTTWKKAGGFKENSIICDTLFNRDVKRIGGKVGVYQGMYMFHAYRINETEQKKAQASVTHLK